MAVSIISSTFLSDPSGLSVPDRLRHAFEQANAHIVRATAHAGPFDRMGTTCTALVVGEEALYVAHVGDSRAYRITKDGLVQLTQDHTYAEALRANGTLTAEQARRHPRRHTLTRAVGISPDLEVDTARYPLPSEPTVFLLCSDGLAEVPEHLLQEIALQQAPQAACEHLIDLANHAGGRDNTTVLVIQLEA